MSLHSLARAATRQAASVPLPTIYAFNVAAESTITLGTTTSLNWSVGDASTVTLTPDFGDVTGLDSIQIKPVTTTTYVLTAKNSAGSVSRSKKITVIVPPVFGSLTATTNSIATGGSTKLSWSATGASYYSVTADNDNDPGNISGTNVTVKPSVTTTYTVTAVNTAGTDARTIKITVTGPKPSISSFTAAPASVVVGNSTTLSWSVSNAKSLSISPDIGAVTGTSITVKPATNVTYTLTASNPSGSVTKAVAVKVTVALPIISSFTGSPASILAGDSTTLGWAVSGADSLSISPGVGTVTGTSLAVKPATNTTYVLTAKNAGGSVTKSVSITVTAPAAPVIGSFTSSPGSITSGQSSTLKWSVTGADSISITADHGSSPGLVTGTSLTVSPSATTVYTLTATNAFGRTTKTARLTVSAPAAPIIASFIANPPFIQAGSPSTLSWSVTGADSVAITADVGPSPGVVSGTNVTVTPAETTTYTLTAINGAGQSTATVPVTIFTVGTGNIVHPRIWVTPATVTSLNARAAANDPAWLKLRADCDAYVGMRVQFPDEDQVSDTINGGYQYNDYLKPSEELALGYLAAKTADPVRAARYAAKERDLLLKLSDPVHHGRPTTDSGYSIRSYVPALALGYDWIFETLSDSDRVQIYTEINRWVASYEATGFGRDFPQGNYFAGYYCAKPLAALATEGENPNGPAMWNDWLNRVHYGMVQPYHAQWLSGGGAPDGWNYGQFETINMVRPIAAAFTAKGLDLIHDAKPFAYPDGHARWITEFTWPDLNSVSDRGFVYNSDNPTGTDAGWAAEYTGLLRLANGGNAPIMQRYTLDLRAMQGSDGTDAWVEFLLQNNAAPAADYRTALSYSTPGDGQVAMRSSWTADAVWASFQSGPYTGYLGSSEEFFDEGALAIQRGSVQFLVNTWGAMMRNTPGTSDGDPVFDDVYNEMFQTQSDDVYTGRRIFNTYYAVRPEGYWGQVGNGPDDSDTTLSRFEEGGNYVLMRGTHLESQYFDDHPISGWTRTIAYVRPQLFIAYDRTSVRTASADNWMAWHVATAPVLRSVSSDGTHTFDVIDTRAGFGGNLFRGRVSTVLPAGHAVKNVDAFNRGKVYRLEVRSGSPVAANTWLTVFDASASSAAAGSASALSATAGNVLAGAVEGTLVSTTAGSNVAVLFSKTGTAVSGGISFAVPSHNTYCLVTDLTPNSSYSITASETGGQVVVQIAPGGPHLATAQGTLTFELTPSGGVATP